MPASPSSLPLRLFCRLLRELASADLAEHLFELLKSPVHALAASGSSGPIAPGGGPTGGGAGLGGDAAAAAAAQGREVLMLMALEVLANLAEDGE